MSLGSVVVAGSVITTPAWSQSASNGAIQLQLQTAPGIRPGRVVIGGAGRVAISDRARLTGSLSNLGTAVTEIGADARVLDVWSQSRVFLRSRARVTGAVVSGANIEKQDGVVVTGGQSVGASFANPSLKLLSSAPLPALTGDVRLEPGQSGALVAGRRYGTVSVKSGATLRLPAGELFIGDLQVEPNGTLLLEDSGGPVKLYISQRGFFRGRILSTQTFPDLLFAYTGTERFPLEASFRGLFVAPNGGVTLARVPEGFHEGQFFAKDVEVHPDTEVRFRGNRFTQDQIAASLVGGVGNSGDRCEAELLLSGFNASEQRYTSVLAGAATAACPAVKFCADAGLGREISLAELQEEIENPDTPTTACKPSELQFQNGNCPVDASSVRNVDCKGSDALCNTAAGEQCVRQCENAACLETAWACAKPNRCDWQLADDPEGCADDIFMCAGDRFKNERGAPTEAEIRQKAGGSYAVSRATFPPVPLDYLRPDQVNSCNGTQGEPQADNEGEPAVPPTENVFETAAEETRSANRPISLGGNQFGLFAFPSIYQSYSLTYQGLGFHKAELRGQGALVAGVRVLGKAITALDVDANAQVSNCGVTGASRFQLFGQDIGSAEVGDAPARECTEALADFDSRSKDAYRLAGLAARAAATYRAGQREAACELAAKALPPNPDGWCLTPAEYSYPVNNVLVAYYEAASALQGARTALAAAAPPVGPGRAEQRLLPPTEFTIVSGEAVIPIGPVALTIAGSLSGSYGINGGPYYKIENGLGATPARFEVGARLQPTFGATAKIFIGVGFDIGVVAVSVGLEGTLRLLEVSVPIDSGLALTQERLSNSEAASRLGAARDLEAAGWGGPQLIAVEKPVSRFKAQATFNATMVLDTLSGHLDAAARVRFLFFSKTFRARLTDWTGQRVPLTLASGAVDVGAPFELPWISDRIGYPAIAPVENGTRWVYTDGRPFPVGTAGLCDKIIK